VEFVADEVMLGQVFLHEFRLSCLTINPTKLSTHIWQYCLAAVLILTSVVIKIQNTTFTEPKIVIP